MSKSKIALIMQECLYPGDSMVYTGGDRYARDLTRLCKDMGLEPVIFQKAFPKKDNPRELEFFESTFEGAKVIGLPSHNPGRLNIDCAQNTQEFRAFVYFTVMLAYPRIHRRSIALSHGLWFDHVEQSPGDPLEYQRFIRVLESIVAGLDRIVSVDTNTINFFGGLFQGRFHHKFTHIPNYVDLAHYAPPEKPKTGNTVVLYPRRLEVLRGYTEMQRIAEELIPKIKGVEFHFCGKAHTPSIQDGMKQWTASKERVQWYWHSFDEMPAVYQAADFAVIPTIGCEGTSLSALEAMACGLPLVSTYVGGLSELVIDGFNGLKVAPVYEDIRDAVEWMIRHPADRERMGRNARTTAEQFGMDKWKRRWSAVIRDLVR